MAKKKKVEKAPREMTHRQLSHHKRQVRRQRIILFGGIAIIVAVVVIILTGWIIGDYLPLHKTILQVYDTKFNTAYFIDALKIYGKSQTAAQIEQNAPNVISVIVQNELAKQGAEKLGINISDEEVKKTYAGSSIPMNDAGIDIGRAQLLPDKLKSDYFSTTVPVSDNQVYMKAFMVESEKIGNEVRDRILNGDNFTMLANEYAQNYTSKTNGGDYGWHPAAIYSNLLGSAIPIDYAFSTDVAAGALSQPLSDNSSYKQVGYWLIRVNERSAESSDNVSANVSAVFLSDDVQAINIKARLEAGEELGPIADEFSQYSPSKEKHGELGLISSLDSSGNISAAFNGYAYNLETVPGKWSNPIRDTQFWTQGGAWIVQVVDKEANRELTTEDQNTLIDQAYSNWSSNLWTEGSASVFNNLTTELQQWAIERAIRELQSTG